MKPITEIERNHGQDAWGRDRRSYSQKFEIEAADINKTREHMLGFNYKSYQFRSTNVGKIIIVLTDHTNWTCWSFNNE
jgi:hypothetical protein